MDPDTFRRDGIVFPAGRIDVAGFTEGYGRFQGDSLRLRGRETYLNPTSSVPDSMRWCGAPPLSTSSSRLSVPTSAEGLRTTDADCVFPYGQDLGEAANATRTARAIPVVLRSGEFSIHSIHLVHGGGPNPSNRDRIGFAMRYISADTRCLSGIDSVTAIRGDCERDYYLLEPRADGEFTAAGLLALERALQYPSGFGEAKRTR